MEAVFTPLYELNLNNKIIVNVTFKYQNKCPEQVESYFYNCPQFCLIKLLYQLAIVAYKFPKIKLFNVVSLLSNKVVQ